MIFLYESFLRSFVRSLIELRKSALTCHCYFILNNNNDTFILCWYFIVNFFMFFILFCFSINLNDYQQLELWMKM